MWGGTPACTGLVVPHGGVCTAVCAAGYHPSPPSLGCFAGALSPPTFTCVGQPCDVRRREGLEAARGRAALRPDVAARLSAALVPAKLAASVVAAAAGSDGGDGGDGGGRPTEALLRTRSWRRRADVASLVLCGNRGVGKSYAAAWAVGQGPRRAPARGEALALWVQSDETCNLEDRDPLLPRLRRCGLLVFDDLGCGDVHPERLRRRTESIVCPRIDRGLDTIVTTNMGTAELRSALTERLLDRLRAGLVEGLPCTRSLRTDREGP